MAHLNQRARLDRRRSARAHNFTASPAGLTPGFYRTTVTTLSSASTFSVPVTLDIAQAPLITLSTDGTQFQSTPANTPNGDIQL